MKALKLIIFGVIALNVIACSKGKWDIQAKNNTGAKTKINGTEVANGGSMSLGKFEKDASTTMKVSVGFVILDSTAWTPENTFTLKPTTDPSNDGDALPVTLTLVQTDSTHTTLKVTATNIEIK